MNSIELKIDGKTYTQFDFPIKLSERLDEELDSAVLTLYKCEEKYFKPTTPCEITITDGITTETRRYIISGDNFNQSPIGSGLYRHELSLIEPTKLLENYQIETLTSTNANPATNIDNAQDIDITKTIAPSSYMGTFPWNLHIDYQTPTASEYIDFPNAQTLFNITESGTNGSASIQNITTGESVAITKDSGNRLPLVNGVNHIRINATVTQFVVLDTYVYGAYFDFSITAIDNRLPRKPKTYIDVINRVLDLVEPSICEDTSIGGTYKAKKFNLVYTQEQADILNQTAPEFSFTRQNLREIMRTIGNAIHGEPYLDYNAKTQDFTDIKYLFYGGNELATYTAKDGTTKPLNEYPIENEQGSYTIENAMTSVDSYVDNLVNRLDWKDNTTATPYENGVQTLRSESAYLRLEQGDNTYFPTSRPIQQIKSFVFIDNNNKEWELKDFIYEETIYNSYLDDYTTAFPSSKQYGLYYTQGGKGIKGFFHKNRNIQGGVLDKYSIFAILDHIGATARPNNYMEYKFRLEYTPIYSERVTHSKSYIGEWLKYPRTINNSQSANMVETKYYGENIKGLVERLGNVDKTITYTCFKWSTIGKIGQLYDNKYYIANVNTEVMKDKFKVSLGLSKNFNRLSQYIGVSSYKRIYEVSETMVQERHALYKDYFIITRKSATDEQIKYDFLGLSILDALKGTFSRKPEYEKYNATSVLTQGKTKSNKALNRVILPVVSSAFGNVIEFTWEMQDNFSAGQKIVYVPTGEITGYFSKDVQYSDYYGEMYYEQWCIAWGTVQENALNIPQTTATLDGQTNGAIAGTVTEIKQGDQTIATFVNKAILKRKDNRERLINSYSVEFVTDEENIIIGSALANDNLAVCGYKRKADGYIAKVYLCYFPEKINKFSSKIPLTKFNNCVKILMSEKIMLQLTTNTHGYTYLSLLGHTATAQANGYKSWAYVVECYDGASYQVENENGEIETITDKLGGDILVAENVEIEQGKTYGNIKFLPYHDVYEFIKRS